MLKIMFAIILGLLCFCGLFSIVSAVCSAFFGSDACEFIVLPVVGHMEDIEFHIRGALTRRRRIFGRLHKLYLADFGADEETIDIAKRMCQEFDVLEWIEYGSLNESLAEIISEETKK